MRISDWSSDVCSSDLAGDYNCLHQDLYGDLVFSLQVAIVLSAPDRDFTGGEFVMNEQRPRRQSRSMVVPLDQGDGVAFAVLNRPARGRSEERSVGKQCVSTCRHRGWRYI